MATRRTKVEIDADLIIKKSLLKLGDKIYEEARKTSRVAKDTYYKDGSINKAGGSLRDSINYRVKPDTTLVMAQIFYGKFNYPKGTNSGEKNALLIAAQKHVDETTNIIVTEINDALTEPFKRKRT
jgi:phage gpG-like protein